MRATVLKAELLARRDVRPVYGEIGRPPLGYECGSTEYTAELSLNCDAEFWEALLQWVYAQREGKLPALPSGAPCLPADSTPVMSSRIKPGTKALPAPAVDAEFEDGDFDVE